ncbi:hypothetical protein BN946_scf184908.g57 [Trametes cinnabarina]|uniref:Uncharacterized protein n=1 Tax=Pycnoporus cinnabarinus TaxID=5643 RepID=A0A060SAG0_PYCCI|nr:hypothetical protein BN946_scf184908.g57 [Trametes cinnabarina]
MNNFDPSRLLPSDLASLFAIIGNGAGAPLLQMRNQLGPASGQFAGVSAANAIPAQVQYPAPVPSNGASFQWQPPSSQYWYQQRQSTLAGGGSDLPSSLFPQHQVQTPQAGHIQAWVQQQLQVLSQPAGAQPGPGNDAMTAFASLLSDTLVHLAQQRNAQQPLPPGLRPLHHPLRSQSPGGSDPPMAPITLSADNDDRILRALKSCKSRKITVRQALERLDGANGHTAAAWKDYFLDHLDRLYALVAAKAEPARDTRGNAPSSSRKSSSPPPATPLV